MLNTNRGRWLATSMMCGLAVMTATSAFAEETTADSTVEEVVITGSRIARPDLVSNTPVQVIGQERLEGQGLENVADVLVTLPQFAPAFGGSRTQSTFSGTLTSGLNASNLRNLGANRSLTLINGRRAPAGVPNNNTVDLNLLPSANISRIDVVTGGASAVYGADAVAGVVNVVTDKSLDGFEIGASYGGINNLFDQDPPFFATSVSGTQALDTIPGYYDIFGRQAYIGFRAKF